VEGRAYEKSSFVCSICTLYRFSYPNLHNLSVRGPGPAPCLQLERNLPVNVSSSPSYTQTQIPNRSLYLFHRMRLRLGAPILVASRLSVHLRVHPLRLTLRHGLHVLPANHRPQAPREPAAQPPAPPHVQSRRLLTRSRLFPTRLFACGSQRRLELQHRPPRRSAPLRASANERTEIACAEHTLPAGRRCQLFHPQRRGQHRRDLETHIHLARAAAEPPSPAADPEPLACGIHTRAAFVQQQCEQALEGVRGVRCPCTFRFGV
jgi:hypothetical protein